MADSKRPSPQLPRNGSKFGPDEVTVVHDLTDRIEFSIPEPGSYDPAGPDGKHRHGDGPAHLHQQGDDPTHGHDADGRLVWPETPADGPQEEGWFGSLSRTDQPTADPAPARDASADPQPRDGDDAGPGRPTNGERPRDPETGRFLVRRQPTPEPACLEQSVLEVEHVTYQLERNTDLRGAMLAAELEMLNGEVAKLDAAVQDAHDSAPWYEPGERAS